MTTSVFQLPFFECLKQLNLNLESQSFAIETMYWSDPILAYVSAVIPEFTDHGKLHSENVFRYVCEIIKNYPVELTEPEKKLLVLASKLHDIGCVYGRENHELHTIRILDEYYLTKLQQNLTMEEINCLKQIIISHVNDYNFNYIISNPIKNIRLNLLCPIFRLCDGLDLNIHRINDVLFNILKQREVLPENSMNIWLSHRAIQNISIKTTNITIWINNFIDSGYCINKLGSEIKEINSFLKDNNFPQFIMKVRTVDSKQEEE